MAIRSPSVAGLGEYPRRYDVPALPDRRRRAAFRFLALSCSITGLLCAGVASAALAIVPLKASTPGFAALQASGIAAIDQPVDVISGGQAYIERMVVDYATRRNMVIRDTKTMREIWGDTGFIAAVEDRDQLGESSAPSKRRMEEMTNLLKSGGSQVANYVASHELVVGEVYDVDLDVSTLDANGHVVGVQAVTATVETAFDPAAVVELVNPLGLRVIAYSEEPRRSR
jgi:hypothetical protein